MKKYSIILFCCLAVVVLMQCKKDHEICPDGLQEATLIGLDLRECVCCGGWIVDLGQDTVRTFSLPDDFDIDPFPEFPVEVCLSYGPELETCKDFERLIVVDQIVRR